MSDLTRRGFIGLAGVALGASATRLLPTQTVAAVDCTAPVKPTLFGSTPLKGGTVDAVATRWGSGVANRVFSGATFGKPSTNPAFSLVHTSYKPSLSAVNSGSLDAAITATAKATPVGHVLEIWHESDRQVEALGTFTFAQIRDAKNRFYRLVKAANPGVLVANTMTGWRWDYKSGYDTSKWGTVNGDILGIDCDGVRPTKLPYTSYEDETNAALVFIDRWAAAGYRYFSVPEFICPRVPDDPEGVARAAWLSHYADRWKATGRCLYACAYEYDNAPNCALTKPAEFNAWKSYI